MKKSSKRILILAPHADDETIGCGSELFLVLCTEVNERSGFNLNYVKRRRKQIKNVVRRFKFKEFFQLKYPPSELDQIGYSNIISDLSKIVAKVSPSEVYLPFRRDVHSDHKVIFDTGLAVTKSFRYPSIQKILCYETLSETDFDNFPDSFGFKPNYFVDISDWINEKISIAKLYSDEFQKHPFPRNYESIKALARLRGGASNFSYSEAFMLLKQRI